MAVSKESSQNGTPFWNMNIPPAEHTAECPDYLLYALTNEKDRDILSTPDTDFPMPTWSETVTTIKSNRLDLLQRVPSDLRLYRQHCADLVREHGSIMSFIVNQRLKWTNTEPSTAPPFTNPDDFTILQNDWPYALPPNTTHLVIWTKFAIPPDPASPLGDLSPTTRAELDDFVNRVFIREGGCAPENVLWFRNWSALKSVHAVEHFHVVLKDPPEGLVGRLTGGDVSEQDKIKAERARGNAGTVAS